MSLFKKFVTNNPLPFSVVSGYFLLQLILLFTYPQKDRPSFGQVIAWDTFGYYLYLPSIFIYHDLFQLKFIPDLMHRYFLSDSFYQAHLGPAGKYVMDYPLGLSLFYTPFFFLGHLIAKIFGYRTDGFSSPYMYAVFIGGVFYALIGIVFTIRNLRFFFSERLTALLMFILLFATNYFYYTAFENAMAHNYLFTITSVLIYLTIKWHEQPRALTALAIGVLLGWAAICRPTEILLLLIPVLWGLYNRQSIVQKIALIKSNMGHILLLIGGVLALGSVQLIYWKISSGHFFYYSYRDNGFNFLHPHIFRGIFSLQKGWLLYTPVMALALLGIPLLWKKKPELFPLVTIFTGIVIYITYSWNVWWYGGSFGQRAMIGSYAILLLPMGFFIQSVFKVRLLQWLTILFIAASVFLNNFQSWQYLHGLFTNEGPLPYCYKLVFLKTHVDRNTIRNYFDLEKLSTNPSDSCILYKTGFEKGAWQHVTSEKHFSDSLCLKLNFSESEKLMDTMVNIESYSFIRLNAKARFEPMEYDSKKFSRLVVTLKDKTGNLLKAAVMPVQPLIGNGHVNNWLDMLGVPGVWDDVYMFVSLPKTDTVQIDISVQNPGYNNLYFDDFRVSLLKVGNSQ